MYDITKLQIMSVGLLIDKVVRLNDEVSTINDIIAKKDAEILQLKSSNRNLVGACDKAKKYIKEIYDEIVTEYDSGTIEEDKNVIIEVIKTLKFIGNEYYNNTTNLVNTEDGSKVIK